MELQEIAQRYRRDGFVHLPGRLSGAELARLRAAVESAPERDPGDNPLSLGTMRFASNLFYGSEAIQAFLASEPVVELVSTLLGPDTWVRWDQAVWKGPGAPKFPLHQDNGYTGLEAEHLQLWVALTSAGFDEGGLVVAPGAHHQPLEHHWVGGHVEVDITDRLQQVDAEAGDVIIFSSYLPHATAPNVTDRTRLAYVAEFLPIGVPDAGVRRPWLHLTADGEVIAHFEDTVDAGLAPAPEPPPATPASPSRRRWRFGRRSG